MPKESLNIHTLFLQNILNYISKILIILKYIYVCNHQPPKTIYHSNIFYKRNILQSLWK